MGNVVPILLLLLQVSVTTSRWTKDMENDNLYEGDIVLDPDEEVKNENKNSQVLYAASIKGGRWPLGKIPYVIDPSIGEKGVNAIHQAIAQYHQYTCLRFHKRTDEYAHVLFTKSDKGCYSPIGYREDRVNVISLAEHCWKAPTIMHELGHTIGMYHEQARADRDNYIKILWDNVNPGRRGEFDYKSGAKDELWTPYDYYSIMHYGPYAFSKNGDITIETKDPNMQSVIGQQSFLSELDKKQIKLMYDDTCSGVIEDCDDMQPGCSFWAGKGLCGPGPLQHWMSENCCHSCQDTTFPGTELLGCFDQYLEPMRSSTLLFNDRSNIIWKPLGFKSFVKQLLTKCRKEAMAKNFTYFSIRFYGECYGGNRTSDMLDMSRSQQGTSSNCVSGDGKYEKVCNQQNRLCVGAGGTDFFYLIKN